MPDPSYPQGANHGPPPSDPPPAGAPASVPTWAKPLEVTAGEVPIYHSRDSITEVLDRLGRQASMALSLRAIRRISVLVELRAAFLEMIAAGFEVEYRDWYARTAYAATTAYAGTADAVASAAAIAADAGFDPAAHSAWRAASIDLWRLKKLALLERQPPLFGWDDPRLGPLWPEGVPEWHRQAQEELRELRQALANRPNPFTGAQ